MNYAAFLDSIWMLWFYILDARGQAILVGYRELNVFMRKNIVRLTWQSVCICGIAAITDLSGAMEAR